MSYPASQQHTRGESARLQQDEDTMMEDGRVGNAGEKTLTRRAKQERMRDGGTEWRRDTDGGEGRQNGRTETEGRGGKLMRWMSSSCSISRSLLEEKCNYENSCSGHTHTHTHTLES